MLNKSLNDKMPPLKVAHSRLEKRTHRPEVESCKDPAMRRYVGTMNIDQKWGHSMRRPSYGKVCTILDQK